MRRRAVLVMTSLPPCVRLSLIGAAQLSGHLDWRSWPAHLDHQRDAVGEAVDVDAGLDGPATQADGGFHDEGVPLQHPHIPCSQTLSLEPRAGITQQLPIQHSIWCVNSGALGSLAAAKGGGLTLVRGNHLGVQLLGDPEAQVILPCSTRQRHSGLRMEHNLVKRNSSRVQHNERIAANTPAGERWWPWGSGNLASCSSWCRRTTCCAPSSAGAMSGSAPLRISSTSRPAPPPRTALDGMNCLPGHSDVDEGVAIGVC